MTTPAYATRMAAYNRWQNAKLLAAAGSLSDAERGRNAVPSSALSSAHSTTCCGAIRSGCTASPGRACRSNTSLQRSGPKSPTVLDQTAVTQHLTYSLIRVLPMGRTWTDTWHKGNWR